MNTTKTAQATKHTPGPWEAVVREDAYDDIDVRSKEGYLICTVLNTKDADMEDEANAALIAAAPDLLAEVREAGYDFAALSSIVSAILTWQDDLPLPVRQKLTHAANIIERRYEPSRAAIAKATRA